MPLQKTQEKLSYAFECSILKQAKVYGKKWMKVKYRIIEKNIRILVFGWLIYNGLRIMIRHLINVRK